MKFTKSNIQYPISKFRIMFPNSKLIANRQSPATIHIGIDGNEANVTHRVGSNWYAFELIKAIYQSERSSDQANKRFTIYLKSAPLPDLPEANSWWQYRVLTPPKAWTQWRLPLSLYLNPDRPQAFFSPGHYAPRFSPIPTVVTVLDLAFLEYPNLFLHAKRGYLQLKHWTEYSIQKSSHLIAISEATKTDIQTHFHYPASKITVCYPGIDSHRFAPQPPNIITQTLDHFHIKSPYILSVGTIQPRKNLVRLIESFEKLPPKYKDYQLVIAGGPGWLMQEFNRTYERSTVKSRIHLIGYVPDSDLPALYSGASCLTLIGIHEGFGIPAAESLACGTIPVVSHNSSLPEVVGPGGGIMVDPFSLTSIKHGIITALDLPLNKKQAMLAAGRAHIQTFKWETAAKQVIQTLYDLTLH
jgi:glycosyltransferase involved in cell wall biosynthesis